MSNEERETIESQKEIGEVTITEYRKNQIMRLGECFIVSPILIYTGIKYRKDIPKWLSATLVGAGVVTLGYNAYNFYQNWNRDGKLIREAMKKKREEESKIREKMKSADASAVEKKPVSSQTIPPAEKKVVPENKNEMVADVPIGINVKEQDGEKINEQKPSLESVNQVQEEEAVSSKIKFDLTEEQHPAVVELADDVKKEPALIPFQIQPPAKKPQPKRENKIPVQENKKQEPVQEKKITEPKTRLVLGQTPKAENPKTAVEPASIDEKKTPEVKKPEIKNDIVAVKKDPSTKPVLSEAEILRVTKEEPAETKTQPSPQNEKLAKLKELKDKMKNKEKFDGDAHDTPTGIEPAIADDKKSQPETILNGKPVGG